MAGGGGNGPSLPPRSGWQGRGAGGAGGGGGAGRLAMASDVAVDRGQRPPRRAEWLRALLLLPLTFSLKS